MKAQVFFCGYGRRSPQDMLELATSLDTTEGPTVLCDVRFWNKGSKARPEWGRKALDPVFTDRYIHLAEFGNAARFDEQKSVVEIADYAAGLTRLRELMQTGRRLLLFCSCGSADNCHRSTLAVMLRVDEIETQEAKWPPAPEGHWWDWNRKTMVVDELAKMEAYATEHPEDMIGETWYELDQIREEFQDTQVWIEWQLDRRFEFVVEEIPSWSREMNLNEGTVISVLRRMERRGMIEQDFGGDDGFYWHWYQLKRQGEKDATRSRRDGSSESGGTGDGSLSIEWQDADE